MIWTDAQRYAGVVALEPQTAFIGNRAAKKKTWSFADAFLRYFVYGNQPNWFPVDSVRRTACATGVGWSYFWHGASGKERDLHAWVAGDPAFATLFGREGADSILEPVLDIARCTEVKGEDAPCLYSEVTLRQQGFERWFCGGSKLLCRSILAAEPNAVPEAFASAAQTCMHGPWVLERVHNWRPEIHPAEVQWVRPKKGINRWLFLLVPDGSGRFDKGGHFEKLPQGTPPGWRPWSTDRPVQLWVAFEVPEDGANYVFDLAAKGFGKHEEDAAQAALRLPAPAAGLQPVEEPFPDIDVSGARWVDQECGCTRGLLLLRSTIQKSANRTVVIRLSGRRATELPPDAEIDGLIAPVAAPAPPKEAVQLRLFGVAREAPSLRPGYVAIRTLARFDPRRPPVYGDEVLANDLNRALKGKKSRRRAFGVERPFRVEWDLHATRDADGSPVPISLAGLATSPSRVEIIAWRGPATSAVLVNGQALVSREKDALVYLGEIWAAVPPGVTLKGKGRIAYEGTKPLELLDLSGGTDEPTGDPFHATIAFRLPAPRYNRAQEWDLVRDVLEEVDSATASTRLATLQTDACWPAPPGPCHAGEPSPKLRDALADPARRLGTLRDLSAGDRPSARFVQLFARALVWDESVGEEERELLQRLLTRTEARGPAASGE